MNNYDDIINLPHYEPRYHHRMPPEARAAQFAPFAALDGHEDAITEAGRLTQQFTVMRSDDDARWLDQRMAMLQQQLHTCPQVTVTYFVPDERKQGGSYRHLTANLRQIDQYNHQLVMTNGTTIPISNIVDIECC